MNPLTFLGRDLAFDLGAATTQIYAPGHGIVLDEPSTATRTASGRILYGATAVQARRSAFTTDALPHHHPWPAPAAPHHDRTRPSADALHHQTRSPADAPRPLHARPSTDAPHHSHRAFATSAPLWDTGAQGVTYWPVCDGGDLTVGLIKHFVTKVHGHPFARPRLVMAAPGDPHLRSALRDLAYQADARRVLLVDHAVATALGAGLPVHDPTGRMIVDIGPHLTRVALLACGDVIASRSLHTGGNAVTAAIAALAAREHSLLVGEAEAEAVKHRTGPAWKPLDRHVIVRGLDPVSRRARVAWLPVQQLYEVTKAPAEAIAHAVASILEGCPAELSADIAAHGAVLTGGGALLRGLPRRLRAVMGIPIRRAVRPVQATALGLAHHTTHPHARDRPFA